jgi:hypothetical protein
MKKITVLFLFSIVISTNLFAQRAGQVGLNFIVGEVTSLGATLNLTDNFALRPLISYQRNTNENQSFPTVISPLPIQPQSFTDRSENNETTLGAGLSALYYFKGIEGIFPYLGITGRYNRVNRTSNYTSTSSFTEISGGVSTVTTRTSQSSQTGNGNGYTAQGILGLQYTFNKRIGVYGEIGGSYNYTSEDQSNSNTSSSAPASTAIGSGKTTSSSGGTITTGVGVIIYFN